MQQIYSVLHYVHSSKCRVILSLSQHAKTTPKYILLQQKVQTAEDLSQRNKRVKLRQLFPVTADLLKQISLTR